MRGTCCACVKCERLVELRGRCVVHHYDDWAAKLWLVEWPTLDATAVVTGARRVSAVLLVAGAAGFVRCWLGGQGVAQRPRAEEARVG